MDVECVECGKGFRATVTEIMGRAIRPSICPGCADDAEKPGRPNIDSLPKTLAKIGINVRKHGAATLENYDPPDCAAVRAVRDFVADVREAGSWAPVRGLNLIGPTGTGKTHLAVAAACMLLDAGTPPHRILFDRASRLITEIQDTYGTGQTAKVLEKREAALVWVLDDLGTEKATPDVLRILHDLLDAREGHPNIITSNLTPVELGDRHGSDAGWVRIASRLGSQNFRAMKVDGRDRRFAA